MDTGKPSRLADAGVTSVQFVLASALALVLFLTFANLVVVQYGRGAVRSALEQGVRAGTVSGPDGCKQQADAVVANLLGGRMSDGLDIDCRIESGVVVARGTGVFEPWTPLTPDFDIAIEVRGVAEP